MYSHMIKSRIKSVISLLPRGKLNEMVAYDRGILHKKLHDPLITRLSEVT